MQGISAKHLVIGCAMILAAWLAFAMKPTAKVADQRDKFDLETMVPSNFGDWSVDKTIVPLKVDPQLQSVVDKIYSQTLSRTYVNRQGQHVMLSIAYGGEQSNNLQLHKPEVCYASQGFQILKISASELLTQYGTLPIKRLMAVQGNRNEPITYWVTVGDKATKTGWEQKLQRLRYGMTGKIPDGMLVRVSNIDPDETEAYRIQDIFVHDMLSAMSPKDRVRLVGTFGA